LVTIHSWGDQDAFAAFTRMRELAERLGVPAKRLRAMEALRSLHTMRAEYATARALCEETIALATQLGDDAAAGSAQVDLASALIHLGELEGAYELAARGREMLADASMHGIYNGMLLASTSAHLGRVARSNGIARQTIRHAEQLGNHYLLAHTTTFAATVSQILHDVERTRSLAAEAARLASECGFAALWTIAAMNLGWCDVEAGRLEDGRAKVQAGFLEYTSSGQRISTTSYSLLLVDAHLACGDAAAAHQTVDAAFEFIAETGERIYEPELHRLRGECLLVGAATRGQRERAAEHLERAIAIAAERKAALFELRAATSLLRLRGDTPARERVARLVERFDAENDCADARNARALLGV